MIEVLVWLLVVATSDGGLDTRLTFKSEAQCVSVLSGIKEMNAGRNTKGHCIQTLLYIKD